tara:strand:- start:6642 stop:6968 length:327 start_codon:yes stop_codon:yes gene_type:complete
MGESVDTPPAPAPAPPAPAPAAPFFCSSDLKCVVNKIDGTDTTHCPPTGDKKKPGCYKDKSECESGCKVTPTKTTPAFYTQFWNDHETAIIITGSIILLLIILLIILG